MTDLRTDFEPKVRPFCNLSTGWKIGFGRGTFDDWCIYFESLSGVTYFPRDSEYFTTLKIVSELYDAREVYKDFLAIYEQVDSSPEANQLFVQSIKLMSEKYGDFAYRMENVYGILYAGMIAEEQKANKVLGKRIKRLGVYQLLFDGFTPLEAANFSRGKKAKDLDIECRSRGF